VEDPAVAVALELLEGGLLLAVLDDDIIVGSGLQIGADKDDYTILKSVHSPLSQPTCHQFFDFFYLPAEEVPGRFKNRSYLAVS